VVFNKASTSLFGDAMAPEVREADSDPRGSGKLN